MESVATRRYLPPVQAIVLAAGKGTRMRSDLPKVLHLLAGVPLVAYPLGVLRALGVRVAVVVVGYGAEQVRDVVHEVMADAPPGWLRFALQPDQNGTGHAVSCGVPELDGDDPVLILSGDVPLLSEASLRSLEDAQRRAPSGMALLTFRPSDPTGYGRITRGEDGTITGIVEQRDASDSQRAINECNAGVYCVAASLLRIELPRLGMANAQGEVYLTDLVEVAARGGEVLAIEVGPTEVAGVNTPEQLTELEANLT